MQTVYLTPNEVPDVLRKAFPSYNGRKFEIRAAESVALSNGYWDGGSKSEYRAVNLQTGQVQAATGALEDPFRCPAAPTVEIPRDIAVVEHCRFCGKDMGLRFHVHPDNLAKLLPDKTTELPWAERVVLYATRSLKSSYGGIRNFRWHEANRATGISADEFDAAKQRLIARKLLNRAGAITPAGRNACNGENCFPARPERIGC